MNNAEVKKLLSDNGISYQDYYNRSDVRCGTTLGLATANVLGMKVCDVGIAELAMHSACETCGVNDIETIERALTVFLSATISDVERV